MTSNQEKKEPHPEDWEERFKEKFCQLVEVEDGITTWYVVKDYHEHQGDWDEYTHWTNEEVKSFIREEKKRSYEEGEDSGEKTAFLNFTLEHDNGQFKAGRQATLKLVEEEYLTSTSKEVNKVLLRIISAIRNK